jgi:hypothetical protein
MILPPIIKRSSNRHKQQQQRTLEQSTIGRVSVDAA